MITEIEHLQSTIINCQNKVDAIEMRLDYMQNEFDKFLNEIKKLNNIITEPIDSVSIVTQKISNLIKRVTENGELFSIYANRLLQINEEIQTNKKITKGILSEVNEIYKTFKENNLI